MHSADLIDDYELIAELGRGSSSTVFVAMHRIMQRRVAIKILNTDVLAEDSSRKRFQREAQLLNTTNNPHIVKIFSSGSTTDNRPYLVLELLDGKSLSQRLKENPIPVSEALALFEQLLDALHCAHEMGIVHRDIKPSNVVLCNSPSGVVAKLVDFGIAGFIVEAGVHLQNLTQTGDVTGTPTYMSPEQCQGKPATAQSDLYSFACLMYECVTGAPPFPGHSQYDMMYHHVHAPPARPGGPIPELLGNIILKGLEKSPHNRYQTAEAMRQALAQIVDEQCKQPLERTKPALRSTSHYRWALITGFLSLFICGVGLVAHQNSRQNSDRSGMLPPATISQQAVPTISQTKSATGRTAILKGMSRDAQFLAEKDHFVEARNMMESALSQYGAQADAGVLTKTYCRLGRVLEGQRNWQEAEIAMAKAEEYTLKAKEYGPQSFLYATMLAWKASVKARHGEYDTALQVLGEADKIVSKLGLEQKAWIESEYSAIYTSQGKIPLALAMRLESYQIYRAARIKTVDPPTLNELMQIAILYYRLGQWDKAENAVKEVKSYLTKDHQEEYTYLCPGLATMFILTGHPLDAIETLTTLRNHLKHLGADQVVFTPLDTQLAYAQFRSDNAEEAGKNITLALSQLALFPEDSISIFVMTRAGEIYLESAPEAALNYLQRAEKLIASQRAHRNLSPQIYWLLGRAFASKKEYKTAIAYFERGRVEWCRYCAPDRDYAQFLRNYEAVLQYSQQKDRQYMIKQARLKCEKQLPRPGV